MLDRKRLQPRLYPPPPPSPSTPLQATSALPHPSPPTFRITAPPLHPPSTSTSTPSRPSSSLQSSSCPSSSLPSSSHHSTSCPPSSLPSSALPPSSRPPSQLSVYSSYQQLQISAVKLKCQEMPEENHTAKFLDSGSGRDYEALLRRGNTLIVCVATPLPLSSPYTLTLTFLSAYRSSDRFGQFRAKGATPSSAELWFSITLPPNFPVGKFNMHIHLSVRGGKDVATYLHNKPVAVLFNPWLPDDDTYLDDTDGLESHMVAEVGTIWRGTSRQPRPLLWEYGQCATGCLDVALQLLQGLSADDRRNAACISRSIVSQVNCRDGRGVMSEGYTGTYTGGVAPCRWNGSPAILQRFHRSRQPVRYGQCWVLAGVAVTLLRALGVASRPVTCYEAAHHCSKLGQLDLAFTPQGEMLDNGTHDRLWVYHVWVEAWMRRDDLPPGYDGWQVLDPTSQQRQGGGVYRIGPVSVATVKEGKEKEVGRGVGDRGSRGRGRGAVGRREGVGKGKSNEEVASSNGSEYVISEVNSDLRFLRVSKSFATITNRVLSVALVQHDHIGGRLVAGSGTSFDPLDITDTYKFVGLHHEAPPTHLPPPTRDCTVDVSSSDGSRLGEAVSLSVTVNNHGPLLRTLDGKVEGRIIRYTGEAVREFVSMQFSGVVAPGQSATVSVPIESRQYMKQLVEQCMMQFFVAVKARESGQLFLKIHHYQPQLPTLDVSCGTSPVTVGKMTRVKIVFRNPLSRSLSRLLFLVQAQGLCAQRELSYKRLVLPGAVAKVEFPVRGQAPGTYHILASLHCDQLTDIHGWTQITVAPHTE